MGQGYHTTIKLIGSLLVCIPTTNYESSIFTCILAIPQNIKKPLLIKSERTKSAIKHVSNIDVFESKKIYFLRNKLKNKIK